jgi:hypothetical protein
MLRKNLLIVFVLIACNAMGQVQELERFRQAITLFVNYDNGKTDSLSKTNANTATLKQAYETAFLQFIQQKESKNLDSLKKHSINNKTSFLIGNNSYFFSTLKRNLVPKSVDSTVDYHVTIYPLYDYQLNNFVSFYIQPFWVDTHEYVVYYCKLNGKGTYYVKDVTTNKIVFQSEGLTNNAPIKKLVKLDAQHLLVIEDMGDNGERALVLDIKNTTWKTIDGFYGKSFSPNTTDYTRLTVPQKRKYFTIATTRSFVSNYGKNYLKQFAMQFEAATGNLQYKKFSNKESDTHLIKAQWRNNMFTIDDYYMGEGSQDTGVPMPM